MKKFLTSKWQCSQVEIIILKCPNQIFVQIATYCSYIETFIFLTAVVVNRVLPRIWIAYLLYRGVLYTFFFSSIRVISVLGPRFERGYSFNFLPVPCTSEFKIMQSPCSLSKRGVASRRRSSCYCLLWEGFGQVNECIACSWISGATDTLNECTVRGRLFLWLLQKEASFSV